MLVAILMALEPQEKLPGMWQQEEPMTGSTRQCTRHQYCMQQCARVTITRSYFEISFSRGKQSESLRNRPLKFGPFEVFGPLGPAYHFLSGRPTFSHGPTYALSERPASTFWGGRPQHSAPRDIQGFVLKSIISPIAMAVKLLRVLFRTVRRWLKL